MSNARTRFLARAVLRCDGGRRHVLHKFFDELSGVEELNVRVLFEMGKDTR